MRLWGGFSLGRWFGFEVRIDYSWFLIFFLVVFTLSDSEFPRQLQGGSIALHYTMGTITALLLFASVLLHELSHSAVARARGLQVEGITLFIFGGVAQTRMEARTAADEFLLTAAGPLCSLALGAVFWGLARGVAGLDGPPPVVAVGETLAVVNVGLAVFNMIPGFPLDGGRIFRSVVWHVTGDVERATRWATRGGQAFGYLLLGLGLMMLWQGFILNGLWSAFIGWFLSSAAGASWEQFRARRLLSRVSVRRAMLRPRRTIPTDASAARVAEEYFLGGGEGIYPVVCDGRLMGVVGVEELAGLSPDLRASTPVSRVMTGASALVTVSTDDTLDDVLAELQAADVGRALVVDRDRVVGLITLEQVGAWLERARKLGLEDHGSSEEPRSSRERESPETHPAL